MGVLKHNSSVLVDTSQSPQKHTVNRRSYDFYLVTIKTPVEGSAASLTAETQCYLYAGCFPAGTFKTQESPKLPVYWKGKVTAKSKEPMKIFSSKDDCIDRTVAPVAKLETGQIFTFQSDKIVKSVKIGTKNHDIAECQYESAAKFKDDIKVTSGWMIVDSSQVTWQKTEPTEFDSIVKLAEPIPISAGDPIGFMGIWESLQEPLSDGAVKTQHQMHVELFAVDDKAALTKFLGNEAGLKSGKKYLKVPKGSKLYSSDDQGGFVHPHELLSAARDYVFEESACTQVKDAAGTVFYTLKNIRNVEGSTMSVETSYVKIENDVKLVTQHDWLELGFSTIEETNDDADGYVDREKIDSDLFQHIFDQVDENGDKQLTGVEIKHALSSDKDLRSDLFKMIAGHPSEWHQTTQQNIKKRIDLLSSNNTNEYAKKANQFEVDRFLKCEFLSQISGLTQKLWHFHPIQFLYGFYSSGLVTVELLKLLAPNTSKTVLEKIAPCINDNLTVYKIDTKNRIAHFLSQLAVENGFNIGSEDLDFSPKQMRKIFGCKGGYKNYSSSLDECSLGRLRSKLWTEEEKYSHNAINLGNYVYANRFENGSEESGDGYKFRGRGLIQLTFRSNYRNFTNTHNNLHPTDQQNFEESPDLVSENISYAVEAAFFYWKANKINDFCDGDSDEDVKKVTEIVNGGDNALPERRRKFRLALEAL